MSGVNVYFFYKMIRDSNLDNSIFFDSIAVEDESEVLVIFCTINFITEFSHWMAMFVISVVSS